MKPFAYSAIAAGKKIVDLHNQPLQYLGEINKGAGKILVWEYADNATLAPFMTTQSGSNVNTPSSGPVIGVKSDPITRYVNVYRSNDGKFITGKYTHENAAVAQEKAQAIDSTYIGAFAFTFED